MQEALNLKIYGVITVGPKGQVIIPKECREDFKIEIGDKFEIAIIDNTAFAIGKDCIDRNEVKKEKKDVDFQGFLNIGTKNQFVIPSNIRMILGIEPGNNLIVLGRSNKGLGFIKNDKIEYVLDYIKENTNV